MPIRPDPYIPGPAPIAPKKKLPGEDADFPGEPPFVDIEGESGRGHREKNKPMPEKGPRQASQDLEIDRSEPGHVESAENAERDPPAKGGRSALKPA